MMASTSDFALLALLTCSTPSAIAINGNKEKNCPAVPVGWIKREWYPDEGTGFRYDIYQNGTETIMCCLNWLWLALVASKRRLLQILLVVVGALQLAACSKTVQWEEEVPLNTGETIWVKRTVNYSLGGGAGNPLDIAYRPDWVQQLEFEWAGKKYLYEGDAQVFVLAISPQQKPVLVANPDDGTWRGRHNYLHCTKPTYVQLVADGTGRTWSWPPAIEPWLLGLPANLMLNRGRPEEMKQRYTVGDRVREDAGQSPSQAHIDSNYVSTFCKARL